MPANVVISPRGEQRLQTGHPWIYRSDIVESHASGGDRVVVRSRRGQVLGQALYSDQSQIALRMLTDGEQEADDALIERRILAAIAFRETLNINATAYRLVHGESDRLPSLIVDQYGDYLVMQALSQGMDKLTPLVVRVLQDRLSPRGILARNDPRTRTLDGLEQKVEVLAGEIPDVVHVHELRVEYEVDLRHGQKTGLFLDQRDNRGAAALYAHGRLLDCFSYNGGFALTMAQRCREVIALDVSEDAVARIKANAARNNVQVDARAGNVFDELRAFERSGERFDTIVLDPPAFAKSKSAIDKASSGYKEINLRALKLLNPGGTLVTCSCSYNISEAAFAQIIYEAAIDAGVHVTVAAPQSRNCTHVRPS